jgi:hypothetical protein
MIAKSHSGRVPGDARVAGYPRISAYRASYAVAFSRGSRKIRISATQTRRIPKCSSSSWTRTSAAFGGRLRFAFGAERRRLDRYRIQDLKKDSTTGLINSAGPSTYPLGKSVRTTRATATQRRSRFALSPRARAAAAIDTPGCWHAATASALKAALCRRRRRRPILTPWSVVFTCPPGL